MRLDEIKFQDFSNWQIKRIRARLLACLNAQKQDYEAYKARLTHREKSEALLLDREPTLMTLAREISTAEVCEMWLYSEDEPEEDRVDLPLDDIPEFAPVDRGAEITERALQAFTSGDRKKNPAGIPYWHYTTPALHKLNAIVVFLVHKGFLTLKCLEDNIDDRALKLSEDFQRQLGLAKSPIDEHGNFKGDYINREKLDDAFLIELIVIHTNDSNDQYILKSIQAQFFRHSSESVTAFQQRIDRVEANSVISWIGCAYFCKDVPLSTLFIFAANEAFKERHSNIPVTFFSDHHIIVFCLKDILQKVVTHPINTITVETLDQLESRCAKLNCRSFSYAYDKSIAKISGA